MPLRRDPKTGLVSMEGVNPDTSKEPYYNDPTRGETRTAYKNFIADETKLLRMIKTIDRTHKPARNLETSLDEQLTFPEHDPSSDPGGQGQGQVLGCPNATERPGMWVQMTSFEIQTADPGAPFLNRLAHFCRQAGIRRCGNAQCVENSLLMDKVIPQCAWPRFREWAVALSACRASFTPEQQATRAYFHLNAAALAGHQLLDEHRGEGKALTGVMLGKEEGQRRARPGLLTSSGITHDGRWGPSFLPPNVTTPAIDKAREQARELGICSNRFWNLALVSEREEVDLAGFMETALKHEQLKHDGHDQCTAGFCSFSSLDSTKLKQLHKCKAEDRKACDDQTPFLFDPELLNKSINKSTKVKGRTVWSISEPFEVSRTKSYVAISHVWSDGTGVGQKTVGTVNRCLFNYLAKIIRDLGHTGIWWDTISIPSDPEARRKAINEMHNNYSEADVTLLHDQYLVNYNWAEDGSPCLALILSPWFTRGWTALELIMSKAKSVKVIYKGPAGEPVIRDLDDEILARDPSRCTRAHWIASSIIRRLRRKDIHNVSDLMAILKPRTTSWERDRMIIAALLCGLDDLGYNVRQDEITKRVIDRVYRLNPSSVLHGQVTIVESGGWSWCPPSLYDLPVESIGDLSDAGALGFHELMVDVNGVLVGSWHYRALEKEEVAIGNIVSNSTNLSVIRKIKDALRHWEYCLLLRDNNRGGSGLGLLVIPVGEGHKDKNGHKDIHCKFVGSVHQIGRSFLEGYDPRFEHRSFRIGEEPHRSEKLAAKFCEKSDPPARPGENFDWLHRKLWMGDSSMGQLLVMRFEADTRTTTAFALQATEKTHHKKPGPTERQVLYCDPEVALSPEPVFTVRARRKHGPDRKSREILGRVAAEQPWPPSTIPALDRTYYRMNEPDGNTNGENFSTDLFRLKQEQSWALFAAIDPLLFTPDALNPYNGVWIGCFPVFGFEFLLFHQPNKNRLEVIKFTGDFVGPKGMITILVEDLDDKHKVWAEYDWKGLPAVPAKVFIAEQSAANGDVTAAELVLVSDREVVAVMENAVIQFRRVPLDGLISNADV